MKSIRYFAVLMLALLGAIAANAQMTFHGKFQLTSETRWGKAVLPAGHYSLTMDSVQSPVVIHSEDGKVSAMAKAEFSGQAAPGGSYIFVTGTGQNRAVRTLNLPQLGRSLIFAPLSQRERETLYSKASETVPVAVAKK